MTTQEAWDKALAALVDLLESTADNGIKLQAAQAILNAVGVR